MKLSIKKILSVRSYGNTHITTATFIDGGQKLVATGVGEYKEGETVDLYFDDKYNRQKFQKVKDQRT